MGCGCNKRASLMQNRRTASAARPIQGGVSAGASPQQIRSLNARQASTPKQIQKMDAQRRRIEQLRRNAIKRKLGN